MLRVTLTALTFALLSISLSPAARADREAVTADGQRVLLKDDGTWEAALPATDAAPEPQAELTVERREPLPTGCRIGLRLRNDLAIPIRSLVLRFTAYKEGPVAYETVTRGFSFIKPTDSQYQDILFRGIHCDDILQVQVHVADKCHAGDITKYTSGADRCLALVKVVESPLVKIFK